MALLGVLGLVAVVAFMDPRPRRTFTTAAGIGVMMILLGALFTVAGA